MSIGSVDFLLTNSASRACEIERLQGFYDGSNTTFYQSTLDQCSPAYGFDLPDNTVPFFQVIHHGTDMWRWDWIRMQLTDYTTELLCSFDGSGVNTAGQLDGSASSPPMICR